jgi:hypothetical protein
MKESFPLPVEMNVLRKCESDKKRIKEVSSEKRRHAQDWLQMKFFLQIREGEWIYELLN